jgi:hypothetical protein
MKKLQKRIIAILAFAVIFAYSCSNDSSSTPTTTVEQDKQNITNTINDFYSCLNTLDDGDFSNFMLYSLFNSTDQTYNDSWIRSVIDNFESQYSTLIVNDKLQFATLKGTYVWNSVSQTWSKTNNSSKIVLIFPSTDTSLTNDAELSLNSYSDTNTSFNGVNYWLPSAANLTLKRNNLEVFSINISNVTFQTGTNFTMPLSATIVVYTAPFTHTFQWDRISNTKFKLDYSSSTPQGCGTSWTNTFELQDADYGNITSVAEDLKSVNGSLEEGNLKIVYAINTEAISMYTDPTAAQINSNINAEVFYNNAKIGDLSYEDVNGQSEIFITYSDGTTENINVYVGDLETQVNNIFANYLN